MPREQKLYLVENESVSEERHEPPEMETPKEILEAGAVSNTAIVEELEQHDFKFDGARERLSSGVFGPLYRVEAKTKEGESVIMVEKVFAPGDKTKTKRFSIYESDAASMEQASVKQRARLGLVDSSSQERKLKKVIIDWLYNEERALSELSDIPGIPKSYGAVYEGSRGSLLEQYIEGFDLFDLAQQAQSVEQINDIFDRYRDTYTQAAERGYIYNDPYGSTVMVDQQTFQPYLIDWYKHAAGSIQSDGPAKEKFEQGLKDLEQFRKDTISQFEEKHLAEVRAAL
ncbi:hypothetical protein HZA85_01870 [Candidatus Uhrbacteria bacterium]|nr:hypothetical protein [Candidatus Uhrbacteria bacterium]